MTQKEFNNILKVLEYEDYKPTNYIDISDTIKSNHTMKDVCEAIYDRFLWLINSETGYCWPNGIEAG